MSLTQLIPAIALTTPLGDAHAYAVIDDSRDEPLKWVCFIDATGENWVFRQNEVRLWANLTEGRSGVSRFSAETMERFDPFRMRESAG